MDFGPPLPPFFIPDLKFKRATISHGSRKHFIGGGLSVTTWCQEWRWVFEKTPRGEVRTGDSGSNRNDIIGAAEKKRGGLIEKERVYGSTMLEPDSLPEVCSSGFSFWFRGLSMIMYDRQSNKNPTHSEVFEPAPLFWLWIFFFWWKIVADSITITIILESPSNQPHPSANIYQDLSTDPHPIRKSWWFADFADTIVRRPVFSWYVKILT